MHELILVGRHWRLLIDCRMGKVHITQRHKEFNDGPRDAVFDLATDNVKMVGWFTQWMESEWADLGPNRRAARVLALLAMLKEW